MTLWCLSILTITIKFGLNTSVIVRPDEILCFMKSQPQHTKLDFNENTVNNSITDNTILSLERDQYLLD